MHNIYSYFNQKEKKKYIKINILKIKIYKK